jgi:hypothetical protein
VASAHHPAREHATLVIAILSQPMIALQDP